MRVGGRRLVVLACVFLAAGCGQTARVFEPGDLAFMRDGSVEPATLRERERCARLWNRSVIALAREAGRASVAMRRGRCLITFSGTHWLAGALFACREWHGTIRFPSHGAGLEYVSHRLGLRSFRLVWNADVDSSQHLRLSRVAGARRSLAASFFSFERRPHGA